MKTNGPWTAATLLVAMWTTLTWTNSAAAAAVATNEWRPCRAAGHRRYDEEVLRNYGGDGGGGSSDPGYFDITGGGEDGDDDDDGGEGETSVGRQEHRRRRRPSLPVSGGRQAETRREQTVRKKARSVSAGGVVVRGRLGKRPARGHDAAPRRDDRAAHVRQRARHVAVPVRAGGRDGRQVRHRGGGHVPGTQGRAAAAARIARSPHPQAAHGLGGRVARRSAQFRQVRATGLGKPIWPARVAGRRRRLRRCTGSRARRSDVLLERVGPSTGRRTDAPDPRRRSRSGRGRLAGKVSRPVGPTVTTVRRWSSSGRRDAQMVRKPNDRKPAGTGTTRRLRPAVRRRTSRTSLRPASRTADRRDAACGERRRIAASRKLRRIATNRKRRRLATNRKRRRLATNRKRRRLAASRKLRRIAASRESRRIAASRRPAVSSRTRRRQSCCRRRRRQAGAE
ncbi:unnamed protein product [Aphis gossypii]|uniref:Uncharacterized protein n=1 Tax=Aphis gossypii TaxID=80765 RepID=A0A9P0NFR8_APHGO|nr:unnamed protein product [Aphis gossypii]